MGLFERIKTALGLGTSTSQSGAGTTTTDSPSRGDDTGASDESTGPTDSEGVENEPVRSDASGSAATDDENVDVTVEHEPEDEPEPEVEPDTDAEDAVKGTDTGSVDADLEDIKGIGPAYAERLREAGVEGVGGLADADVAAVAAESGIAESRIRKWVDRARTH
jgi:predicted flap endonuclease-1-like 5' DNA nuclease